ncbi:hypothetical protein GCM10009634_22990 [Saccharothrix xinjiangensis]
MPFRALRFSDLHACGPLHPALTALATPHLFASSGAGWGWVVEGPRGYLRVGAGSTVDRSNQPHEDKQHSEE